MKTFKKYITETLSSLENPTSDSEILRLGILAEIDATNLYEQLAEKAEDERVKKMMLDIAYEEKVHISEFKALLNILDKEQVKADKEAEKETKEKGLV